jgi:hypothetical protein
MPRLAWQLPPSNSTQPPTGSAVLQVHRVFSSSCGEGEGGGLRVGIGLGDKLLERGLVEADGVTTPRRGDGRHDGPCRRGGGGRARGG